MEDLLILSTLSALSTHYKFSLPDPPLVSLRLGPTLSEDIKEGDDVYFECQASANPPWRKLYWLHDVSIAVSG